MQPGEVERSVLEELAIFPLPDIVLFPHALLPLHIFEPRYRDMIAAVLAGPKVLAVTRLKPGYEAEYAGRPEVEDIAGLGYCVAADRLPDGRYNIMLRGVGRVRIEAEHPPAHSYRTVRARLLVDTRSRVADLEPAHAALVALLDKLAATVPDGEPVRQLARVVPSPAGCADAVASALVRDPDARQKLLELMDPADRLAQVTDHVTALIAQLSGGGEKMVN
jgi:uncharacterized protein